MENLTCIVCPNGCSLSIEKTGEEWVVKGNRCPKGKEFAINEMIDPRRSICSTVRTSFRQMPRLSVKTKGEVPLKDIFNVMEEINSKCINKPVHVGEVVIENVCNTGIDVVATSDLFF